MIISHCYRSQDGQEPVLLIPIIQDEERGPDRPADLRRVRGITARYAMYTARLSRRARLSLSENRTNAAAESDRLWRSPHQPLPSCAHCASQCLRTSTSMTSTVIRTLSIFLFITSSIVLLASQILMRGGGNDHDVPRDSYSAQLHTSTSVLRLIALQVIAETTTLAHGPCLPSAPPISRTRTASTTPSTPNSGSQSGTRPCLGAAPCSASGPTIVPSLSPCSISCDA